MLITKRNGTEESYNREKIAVAIKKSFASTGRDAVEETIREMVGIPRSSSSSAAVS